MRVFTSIEVSGNFHGGGGVGIQPASPGFGLSEMFLCGRNERGSRAFRPGGVSGFYQMTRRQDHITMIAVYVSK